MAGRKVDHKLTLYVDCNKKECEHLAGITDSKSLTGREDSIFEIDSPRETHAILRREYLSVK